MSHINYNRSCYRSEVKSKIGDYIRGKISAQSLMHPSRVNTKPIDKRKFNLHSSYQNESTTTTTTTRPTVTDYQKKVRRPPLKDYIEGKVKLCDMISPSKITYIPKERKYQNLLPPYDGGGVGVAGNQYQQRRRAVSVADSVETVTTANGSSVSNRLKDDWDVAKCQPLLAKTTTISSPSSNCGGGGGGGVGGGSRSGGGGGGATAIAIAGNRYSLVPVRSAGCGPPGKRKLMCKIKVQRNGRDNGQQGGSTRTKIEEHIIEIPEKMLRRGGHRALPKFLMDRYNIPCHVNGGATDSAAKYQSSGRKAQLSIEDVTSGCDEADAWSSHVGGGGRKDAGVQYDTHLVGVRREAADNIQKRRTRAIEYPSVADGEMSGGGGADLSGKLANADVENVPSEQGDYNNATTYVFEFYEEEEEDDDDEEVTVSEVKSAIIEEVEDEDAREYGGAKMHAAAEEVRCGRRRGLRRTFNGSLRSDDDVVDDEYQRYEDFKSNIHVQRELMDLHRGMLKCDKHFMVVEHAVNEVTASLNALESAQIRDIRPSVVAVKMNNEKMRLELQALAAENEELKRSVQHLRKKTTDYDKVISCMRQDNGAKMLELESKLETLTQTQVKSIEMQNSVNKNLVRITRGMKRVYTEQGSKRCCDSINSHKHSNLTVS